METLEIVAVYLVAYGSLIVVVGIAVYMVVLWLRERRDAPPPGVGQ